MVFMVRLGHRRGGGTLNESTPPPPDLEKATERYTETRLYRDLDDRRSLALASLPQGRVPAPDWIHRETWARTLKVNNVSALTFSRLSFPHYVSGSPPGLAMSRYGLFQLGGEEVIWWHSIFD
jgi:hypothetical protein